MLKQRGFRPLTHHSSVQGFSRLGFLVRVVLYGGVTASLVLIWQVGIADNSSEATNPLPVERTAAVPLKDVKFLSETIAAQKQHYRTHNRFQVSEQLGKNDAGSANYRQKIWTASDAGPFQEIDGQAFPPNSRNGVVITGESKKSSVPHYIAAIFVGNNDQFVEQVCQTFSELAPSKMVLVLKDGVDRILCPEGTAPIDAEEDKTSG